MRKKEGREGERKREKERPGLCVCVGGGPFTYVDGRGQFVGLVLSFHPVSPGAQAQVVRFVHGHPFSRSRLASLTTALKSQPWCFPAAGAARGPHEGFPESLALKV